MEVQAKKRHSILPRTGTGAAKQFFQTWVEINRFFNFVMALVCQTEATAEVAHQALIDTAHSPEERSELEKRWESRTPTTQALKSHRQVFLEIILARHIENYLNYLSSLLYEVFTQRSETLRSSDKVELAKILRHDSIESLVREIAERKVESLSYSSYRDLAEFFLDRFGVALANPEETDAVIEAVEIRNISVHNRCIVNRRFIARTGSGEDQFGKTKMIVISYMDLIVPMLADLVHKADKSVRKKLKIKGQRFGQDLPMNWNLS